MGKEKTNERHQYHFILVQTHLPKRKQKQIYRQKMCATVVQWMLNWNVKFSNWVLELVYRPNLTGDFQTKN